MCREAHATAHDTAEGLNVRFVRKLGSEHACRMLTKALCDRHNFFLGYIGCVLRVIMPAATGMLVARAGPYTGS